MSKIIGSKKHQEIVAYILRKVILMDYLYKTEYGIKGKNKKFRVDIFAYNEGGNEIVKRYKIIHIPYKDFKVIQKARKIENKIGEILKDETTNLSKM